MLSIDFEKLPTYRMGMEKGIEKGMEKGAYAQALIIAQNLLSQQMDVAHIASATGLPLAEIKQLQSEKITRFS